MLWAYPRPTAVPTRRSTQEVASAGRRIQRHFQGMAVSRIGSVSGSRCARLSPSRVAGNERSFVFNWPRAGGPCSSRSGTTLSGSTCGHGSSNGKKGAHAMRDRLLRAVPFPTALQNQAVGKLVKIAKAQGKNSPEYKSALADFMTEWGGRPARGMAMMPSIPSWREAPEVVNGLVDALISDSTAAPEEALRREEADFRTARAEVESRLWSPLRRLFRRHLEFARNSLIVTRGQPVPHGDHDPRRSAVRRCCSVTCWSRQASCPRATTCCSCWTVNWSQWRRENSIPPNASPAASRDLPASSPPMNAGSIGWSPADLSQLPSPRRPSAAQSQPTVIRSSGRPAAAGVATGPVCVVHGPHEFSKLRKGDVLVARFAAPVWTPLFRLASAVVTEIGSPAGPRGNRGPRVRHPTAIAVPRGDNPPARRAARPRRWRTGARSASWMWRKSSYIPPQRPPLPRSGC